MHDLTRRWWWWWKNDWCLLLEICFVCSNVPHSSTCAGCRCERAFWFLLRYLVSMPQTNVCDDRRNWLRRRRILVQLRPFRGEVRKVVPRVKPVPKGILGTSTVRVWLHRNKAIEKKTIENKTKIWIWNASTYWQHLLFGDISQM